LTLAIGFMLTSCALPQETTLLNDQKCRSDGFQPGTSEYDKCRMDSARQQENLSRAMSQQQDRMQQNMQSISRMPTR